MHKIKGNPVNNAEEYELLYFIEEYGTDYVSNYAEFLNGDIVIDENNNIVEGTNEGFCWSNFTLVSNSFSVPYAYKAILFYNEGGSHIVWSQDLDESNGYMVNIPEGIYADYPQYALYVGVCWKNEEGYDPYNVEITFGSWTDWDWSDVIDFEIEDSGIYAVRAHGAGHYCSDLSNCIAYELYW